MNDCYTCQCKPPCIFYWELMQRFLRDNWSEHANGLWCRIKIELNLFAMRLHNIVQSLIGQVHKALRESYMFYMLILTRHAKSSSKMVISSTMYLLHLPIPTLIGHFTNMTTNESIRGHM